jgi:RNA polymerase sigma-70 factor (sigma-E family)
MFAARRYPNQPAATEPLDFDEYLATYADGLLVHATVISVSPHTAQDIVQTVLERALRRWDTISNLQYPDAYVRRMVVNEFISLHRRMSRVLLTDRAPELPAVADHAGQISDRAALIGALHKLPNRQRAAIALRYWNGLSDAQIADQLGCSESTARGYIFRGLRRLKLEFDEPIAAANVTSMTWGDL